MSRQRVFNILEAVFFLVALETGLWVVAPHLQTQPAAVALYWCAVATLAVWMLWISPFCIHKDTPDLRGWWLPREAYNGRGRFAAAWPAYAVLTASVLAVVLPVAYVWRGFHLTFEPTTLLIKFSGYLLLGPIQSLCFFGFLLARVRGALGATSHNLPLPQRLQATGLVAVCFSLIHLPNLPLTAITLAAGFVWANLFLLRPNIWCLGLSHAILGTVLGRVVELYMRIGPFYDHPELYALRAVIPGLKALIGTRF